MTNPYAPDVATRRKIIESELRAGENTIAQFEYALKVEQRIAAVVGEASAQRIKAIELELRVMAARIEAYTELLSELPAEAAITNGVHA
jgi:hypothetical protein